ncbi:MAG: PriCT-2 domain-containing protein [Muribaculaceae bacterium]|nr:PriCT-2 domain-containing protein [Muribaculaceae bacterium]
MKNTYVSLFKDYKSKLPIDTITLYEWLTTNKFQKWAEKIRSISDKKLQRELKAQLPCITPSGIFSYCRDNSLDQHSGFICVDIDGGEANPGIKDFELLKETLRKCPVIAYCGLSISGNGIFCIIPIKYPHLHKQHFYALEEFFKKININIDSSCKNVSRLRGASFDPNPIINLEARKFSKTMEKPIKEQHRFKYQPKEIITKNGFKAVPYHFALMIKFIDDNDIDITENRGQWFKIGCALASEYGEEGRPVFHEFSKHYKTKFYHYTQEETDKMFDTCMESYHRYSYSIGTFYYYCKEHGVI